MIAYGIACLVVCALSLFDRRAMPFALTLSVAWALGFGPFEAWWVISLAEGAVFASLLTHRSPLWQRIVGACVVPMLLLDAAFWLCRANYIDIGVPYANALNVLFVIQLGATAFPGGRRLVGLGVVLIGRAGAQRRRSSGLGAATRGQTPATNYGSKRAGARSRNGNA